MKRTYVKPIFAAESFQLNAAVAATCKQDGYIPINHYDTTCSFDNGEFFSENNCRNNVVGNGGDDNDNICYHGPVGMTFIYS